MSELLTRRLQIYQFTAIFSLLFALAGFSYNVWRMEISEQNNTIRTASFEILTELAEFEQLVYIAVYDGDLQEGSPRKGWVKVGLVYDLSVLTDPRVVQSAEALKATWSNNWQAMTSDPAARDAIVEGIDGVRHEIKMLINSLD